MNFIATWLFKPPTTREVIPCASLTTITRYRAMTRNAPCEETLCVHVYATVEGNGTEQKTTKWTVCQVANCVNTFPQTLRVLYIVWRSRVVICISREEAMQIGHDKLSFTRILKYLKLTCMWWLRFLSVKQSDALGNKGRQQYNCEKFVRYNIGWTKSYSALCCVTFATDVYVIQLI